MSKRKELDSSFLKWPALEITTVACLLFVLCGTATGQGGALANRKTAFSRVPSLFERQRDALGRRAIDPGKELSVYTGEFVDAITGKRSMARVFHQTPALVRLEGFNSPDSLVLFDGTRATGVLSRTDELLLETFLMDSTEGILASVQGPAAVRFLGARFRPDLKVAPNYTGPRSDIFEVTTPVLARSDRLVRIKLYFFDSDTALLQKTRYDDRTVSRSVKVETRFSQWGKIDGSLYPGRIERYEDGRLIFSFTVASITAGPKVDTGRPQ